jgi:PKD repeat protein
VTTDATTVYLKQQSESGVFTGTVDPSGSQTFSPSETTTYTLTATNDAGSDIDTITIAVNPAVIIEQTIIIQPDPEEEKDCWVAYGSSNNSGTSNDLIIDNGYVFVDLIGNASSNIARSLLQFDLSDLPEDAVIVNAYLKLYQNKSYGGTWSIGVHQVTERWEEAEVIWIIQPDFLSTPESTTSATIADTGWLSWDIASLVQRWLNGDVSNDGVVLKATEEYSQDGYIKCYLSDYTTSNLRPKLEVTCYLP